MSVLAPFWRFIPYKAVPSTYQPFVAQENGGIASALVVEVVLELADDGRAVLLVIMFVLVLGKPELVRDRVEEVTALLKELGTTGTAALLIDLPSVVDDEPARLLELRLELLTRP